MLDDTSTLTDVAFAVCTALHREHIEAILTGGAAANFYAPSAYQSRDADFVLRFAARQRDVDAALKTIDFERDRTNLFRSLRTLYTVDFPKGPLMVGSRSIPTWTTEHRSYEILHILDVTDCVRDRFMGYYAWNDFSSLQAAVAVARARRQLFDSESFRTWARAEADLDSSYDLSKLDQFYREFEGDA